MYDRVYAQAGTCNCKRISWAPSLSLPVNTLQLYLDKCDVITTSSAEMDT